MFIFLKTTRVLRFDVEIRNVATITLLLNIKIRLRFDVEIRNVATHQKKKETNQGCGLM